MHLIYFGAYTKKIGKGMYSARFDETNGRLADVRLAASVMNPSFLAVHPNRRFLYAVSELDDYHHESSGAVVAYAINDIGELSFLNAVASCGAWPCHLTVDSSGQNVIVANYGGGNVVVLRIGENGHLSKPSTVVQHAGSSVHPVRQQKPHAHSVTPSPDNRFALVADLGLDQVLIYRFDSTHGLLSPNQPPFARIQPGAGPRHCAFHPNGRLVYVINELQSTVTVFEFDAAGGALKESQTISTLPENFQGDNATAEIQVHPSGRFLYGSNRGHDSISIFAIHPQTGTLAPLGHVSTQGKTPRHFGIDPTGSYLLAANQDSDNVLVFQIDKKSGDLVPTGRVIAVPSPACVSFVAV